MTMTLYPWEDAELLTQEQAAEELADDAEYDEWLTAINEAWLDDALADIDFDTEIAEAYVPFQNVPSDWGRGTMEDEPGYLESTAPYLF